MKKVRNSSNGLSSARYLSPKRRLCRDRNSSPRHADGTGFSVVGEKPKSGRNRVEFLKKTTSDPLKQPFVSKNVKTLDSSGAIIEHDGLSRPCKFISAMHRNISGSMVDILTYLMVNIIKYQLPEQESANRTVRKMLLCAWKECVAPYELFWIALVRMRVVKACQIRPHASPKRYCF